MVPRSPATMPKHWKHRQSMTVFLRKINQHHFGVLHAPKYFGNFKFTFIIIVLAATREYQAQVRPAERRWHQHALTYAWRHYDSRELYFCGLPGVARKARKHYKDTAIVAYLYCHNLPKQCDGTLCWCRQVRRQRTRWHVYLQLQMCWGRAKGTAVRY